MKSILTLTLSILLVVFCKAQESTTITIQKKNGKEVVTDEMGEKLSQRGMYRWQPWMVWDRAAQEFKPNLEVFPSLGFEYDMSAGETAHFYNLGADVGTERLMVGMVLRIPSHNPRIEEQGGIQVSIRALKRWDFRKIETTQLRITQKRRAHFQAGIEYIFDSHVTSSNSEESASKRVSFISPTVGVFHPIYDRFLIGVKYKKNFKLRPEMNNYSDLSLNFSYFFDT